MSVFKAQARAARLAAILFASIVVAACGTPAPRDFGGAWTPVNRFQNAPTEIPLTPAYTFYASPLDRTLQAMLQRWATDSGRQLNYQAGSDFTLHQPVGQIRTTDLQEALKQLGTIYAAQGLAVAADARRIYVQVAAAPSAEQQ